MGPLAVTAFILLIQKVSQFFNLSLSVYVDTFALFIICTIIIDFALILRLWPGKVKFLSTSMVFASLTLFKMGLFGAADGWGQKGPLA